MASTPCFVVIPQVPPNQRWASFGWSAGSEAMTNQPTPALALTKQLLDELLAKEPVDPDRVYVTGLSMGGYGTWEMIQRWPAMFAAAIPVCGGGDPAQAKQLTKLPVWAWHGEADATIKVEKTRQMIEAITAAGGQPKATYIPNGGHNAWTAAYRDAELLKWLLAQRRR
jgi:predicted peptidase